VLNKFINKVQLSVLHNYTEESEESQFFIDKIQEITNCINKMPVTYETEELQDPIVYLHYFHSVGDAYITERDIHPEQNQAFGYINIGMGGELGYISIKDLIQNGFELDLYFTQRNLSTIIGEHNDES